MEERNIDTWEQFVQQMEEVRRECNNSEDHVDGSGMLFRGQENSCWPLSTTLDRKQLRMSFQDYYGIISRIKSQIESLTDQEWVIPQPPEIERLVQDYDKFSRELWAGERRWYAYMNVPAPPRVSITTAGLDSIAICSRVLRVWQSFRGCKWKGIYIRLLRT